MCVSHTKGTYIIARWANEKVSKESLLEKNVLKGTNQIAVRSHNERLVLQLVREHGELTKAEATRATGLSPNASSVIFRSLEDDNLLVRGMPIRGKIGQPSTPMRINPDARYYVTLKIGRRNLELAVVNFAGDVVSSKQKSQPYPTPKSTLEFLKSNMNNVLRSAKKSRKSISRMAVAMPFELWSWTDEVGAPTEEMESWRSFDVRLELEKLVPWDILIENDATAACRAELLFGSHSDKQDWIYFYVGSFIGGGVVLNRRVYTGRRGNAGGFGPLRVPDQKGGERLVDHASLVVLERSIAAEGGEPFSIYQEESGWGRFEPHVSKWILRAARNLAHAIVSSQSVLDFEAVVIDGAMPNDIKTKLVDEVKKQLLQTDLQGVNMPKVEAGQIGRRARTIGAAAAIISSEHMDHQDITQWG